MPRIPHGCGCGCGYGAGQQLQLRFHPLPGTLPVPRVRPSVHKHPVKSHPHHPSLQSDSDPLCFCFNARGEPPSGLKPGPALGSRSGPAPAHRVLGMTRWVDFCQATTGSPYLCSISLTVLFLFLHTFILSFSVLLWRASPGAYGGSQRRGPGGTAAACHSPCPSHSHAGSKPPLQAPPQLTAMPDP